MEMEDPQEELKEMSGENKYQMTTEENKQMTSENNKPLTTDKKEKIDTFETNDFCGKGKVCYSLLTK